MSRKVDAVNINRVKEKHETDLMNLPNVVGVGIGEKTGKPVIKVFVTHKVPESDLKPYEIVPKKLDQFETDVEEIGVPTAQKN
ncbi:MAG: hypothetical protein L0226_13170 [Acidobacteria bacterium]|nr:hypothetical protein [Acidobacteriota bacterium]